MQLTSIVALLTAVATMSVQAAPTTSLEERQATIAILRFHAGNGCEEPWLEDTVFFQSDKCASNTYTAPYGSLFFQNNYFTRTGKLPVYQLIDIVLIV